MKQFRGLVENTQKRFLPCVIHKGSWTGNLFNEVERSQIIGHGSPTTYNIGNTCSVRAQRYNTHGGDISASCLLDKCVTNRWVTSAQKCIKETNTNRNLCANSDNQQQGQQLCLDLFSITHKHKIATDSRMKHHQGMV